MTTEDPKTESEVPKSRAPEPMPDARRWKLRKIGGLLAGFAAVGTMLAGLTGYWTTYRTVTKEILAPAKPGPIAPRLSIVVLPFSNLTGDASQDYLADALTDELTTAIARIRNSFVIARNTAFTYRRLELLRKAIDAKTIGMDLGVRYVLEGSVQPSGNRVRVNAQLIDAESGAHLWAEQFDTVRGDLLQMQDEIVTRLARALDIHLMDAEVARLKQVPATNANAEDLALRCKAAEIKAGFIGTEAEAGYQLCEQALEADPNNVRALSVLSLKFWLPVMTGRSADPKADLRRADELVSRALAIDQNYAASHVLKADILSMQRRLDETIAEAERALTLDPTAVSAYAILGDAYSGLGQYEKSLEFYDKAIHFSPHDISLSSWYTWKAQDYFGLKQYDQAIEWACRALAITPSDPYAHGGLIAALALTGHEAEAHEALQRYFALGPIGPRTIAAHLALKAQFTNPRTDPRVLDHWDRITDGLRKAGMPEE
jgi:adenylate cyclase